MTTVQEEKQRPEDAVLDEQPVGEKDLLQTSINEYFHKMPTLLETTWLQRAKRTESELIADGSQRRFTVGSICSGSDVIAKCLDAVAKHFREHYNISVVPEHVFQCEINPTKREHLRTHCPCKYMFKEAKDLGGTRAIDLISGLRVLIPYVWLFSVGFPCTSRTPLPTPQLLTV